MYPTGIISCVSDSYDIYNACEHIWGEDLHDKVLSRDGTLVLRSDSGLFWFDLKFSKSKFFVYIGDPLEVLPRLLDILYSKFSGHINEKGFKVLDKHVRVIQGDGVNRNSIKEILQMLEQNGFAADNIVFGSGGTLIHLKLLHK